MDRLTKLILGTAAVLLVQDPSNAVESGGICWELAPVDTVAIVVFAGPDYRKDRGLDRLELTMRRHGIPVVTYGSSDGDHVSLSLFVTVVEHEDRRGWTYSIGGEATASASDMIDLSRHEAWLDSLSARVAATVGISESEARKAAALTILDVYLRVFDSQCILWSDEERGTTDDQTEIDEAIVDMAESFCLAWLRNAARRGRDTDPVEALRDTLYKLRSR